MPQSLSRILVHLIFSTKHRHRVFGLSRTRTIAEVVETVKTSSSKWIKGKAAGLALFHWRTGYGRFR